MYEKTDGLMYGWNEKRVNRIKQIERKNEDNTRHFMNAALRLFLPEQLSSVTGDLQLRLKLLSGQA